MDIHGRLVAVVAESTTPAGALSAAAQLVAEVLHADACALFVRRTKNSLELTTQHGPVNDEVATDFGRHLAEETLEGIVPRQTTGPGTSWTAAVPVAAINQAIGAIVVRRVARSFTAEEVMRLSGVASQIVELKEVDFFSIGTNDLLQYRLVVDREDARMASERHSYHPAIFRMIHRVVTSARASGKRVGVCGEMAARPELALALLALGVDSLSVTPRFIPDLKQALAQLPVEPLRAGLDGLLNASTTDAVEAFFRSYARRETP